MTSLFDNGELLQQLQVKNTSFGESNAWIQNDVPTEDARSLGSFYTFVKYVANFSSNIFVFLQQKWDC